jgi:hypothetical protein
MSGGTIYAGRGVGQPKLDAASDQMLQGDWSNKEGTTLGVLARLVIDGDRLPIFLQFYEAVEGATRFSDVAKALANFQANLQKIDGQMTLGAKSIARSLLEALVRPPTDPQLITYLESTEAINRFAVPFVRAERILAAVRNFEMRKTPGIQALLSGFVPKFPELAQAIRDFTARSEEFRGVTEDGRFYKESKENSHRLLTGLLVGLLKTPRTAVLLMKSVMQHMSEQSASYWDVIARGGGVVDKLVVGTGPNAVNFISALSNLRGGVVDFLCLDAANKPGGVFGGVLNPDMIRALWRLNSRTRPQGFQDVGSSPDGSQLFPDSDFFANPAAFLPGGDFSLNPVHKGVVQDADLTGQVYSDNSKIWQATVLNNFLQAGSAMMSGISVDWIKRNPNRGPDEPRFLVRVVNTNAPWPNNSAIIKTNIPVDFGGFRREKVGAALADEQTRAYLQEQQRLLLEQRNCVSGMEFIARMGDRSEPFPLRGKKKIVILGDGDTARIVAGSVLGTETELGQTVASLDRVDKVVWVGQKASSREKFLAREPDGKKPERPRYLLLANFFPREVDANYAFKIQPYDVRAGGIRVDGGRASVAVTGDLPGIDRGQLRNDLLIDDSTLVVDCRGFEKEELRALRFLNGENLSAKQAATRSQELIRKVGTTVRYKPTGGDEPQVSSVEVAYVEPITDQSSKVILRYEYTDGNSELSVIQVDQSRPSQQTVQNIFDEKRVEGVDLTGRLPNLETVTVNLDQYSLPAGKKVAGEPIYIGGVASGLPPSDAEYDYYNDLEPGAGDRLRAIVEANNDNSAALFLYYLRDLLLAKHIAQEDLARVNSIPTGLTSNPQMPQYELMPDPMTIDTGTTREPLAITLSGEDTRSARARIKEGESAEDNLRLAVGTLLKKRTFQSGAQYDLEFKIRRADNDPARAPKSTNSEDKTDQRGDAEVAFVAEVTAIVDGGTRRIDLQGNGQWDSFIKDLFFKSKDFQQAIYSYTTGNATRVNEVTITVPVARTKPVLRDMEINRTNRQRIQNTSTSIEAYLKVLKPGVEVAVTYLKPTNGEQSTIEGRRTFRGYSESLRSAYLKGSDGEVETVSLASISNIAVAQPVQPSATEVLVEGLAEGASITITYQTSDGKVVTTEGNFVSVFGDNRRSVIFVSKTGESNLLTLRGAGENKILSCIPRAEDDQIRREVVNAQGQDMDSILSCLKDGARVEITYRDSLESKDRTEVVTFKRYDAEVRYGYFVSDTQGALGLPLTDFATPGSLSELPKRLLSCVDIDSREDRAPKQRRRLANRLAYLRPGDQIKASYAPRGSDKTETVEGTFEYAVATSNFAQFNAQRRYLVLRTADNKRKLLSVYDSGDQLTEFRVTNRGQEQVRALVSSVRPGTEIEITYRDRPTSQRLRAARSEGVESTIRCTLSSLEDRQLIVERNGKKVPAIPLECIEYVNVTQDLLPVLKRGARVRLGVKSPQVDEKEISGTWTLQLDDQAKTCVILGDDGATICCKTDEVTSAQLLLEPDTYSFTQLRQILRKLSPGTLVRPIYGPSGEYNSRDEVEFVQLSEGPPTSAVLKINGEITSIPLNATEGSQRYLSDLRLPDSVLERDLKERLARGQLFGTKATVCLKGTNGLDGPRISGLVQSFVRSDFDRSPGDNRDRTVGSPSFLAIIDEQQNTKVIRVDSVGAEVKSVILEGSTGGDETPSLAQVEYRFVPAESGYVFIQPVFTQKLLGEAIARSNARPSDQGPNKGLPFVQDSSLTLEQYRAQEDKNPQSNEERRLLLSRLRQYSSVVISYEVQGQVYTQTLELQSYSKETDAYYFTPSGVDLRFCETVPRFASEILKAKVAVEAKGLTEPQALVSTLRQGTRVFLTYEEAGSNDGFKTLLGTLVAVSDDEGRRCIVVTDEGRAVDFDLSQVTSCAVMRPREQDINTLRERVRAVKPGTQVKLLLNKPNSVERDIEVFGEFKQFVEIGVQGGGKIELDIGSSRGPDSFPLQTQDNYNVVALVEFRSPDERELTLKALGRGDDVAVTYSPRGGDRPVSRVATFLGYVGTNDFQSFDAERTFGFFQDKSGERFVLSLDDSGSRLEKISLERKNSTSSQGTSVGEAQPASERLESGATASSAQTQQQQQTAEERRELVSGLAIGTGIYVSYFCPIERKQYEGEFEFRLYDKGLDCISLFPKGANRRFVKPAAVPLSELTSLKVIAQDGRSEGQRALTRLQPLSEVSLRVKSEGEREPRVLSNYRLVGVFSERVDSTLAVKAFSENGQQGLDEYVSGPSVLKTCVFLGPNNEVQQVPLQDVIELVGVTPPAQTDSLFRDLTGKQEGVIVDGLTVGMGIQVVFKPPGSEKEETVQGQFIRLIRAKVGNSLFDLCLLKVPSGEVKVIRLDGSKQIEKLVIEVPQAAGVNSILGKQLNELVKAMIEEISASDGERGIRTGLMMEEYPELDYFSDERARRFGQMNSLFPYRELKLDFPESTAVAVASPSFTTRLSPDLVQPPSAPPDSSEPVRSEVGSEEVREVPATTQVPSQAEAAQSAPAFGGFGIRGPASARGKYYVVVTFNRGEEYVLAEKSRDAEDPAKSVKKILPDAKLLKPQSAAKLTMNFVEFIKEQKLKLQANALKAPEGTQPPDNLKELQFLLNTLQEGVQTSDGVFKVTFSTADSGEVSFEAKLVKNASKARIALCGRDVPS